MVRLASFILLAITLLLVNGCGSTPTRQTLPEPIVSVKADVLKTEPVQLTAEQLINRSQQTWSNVESNEEALNYLLLAAEQWLNNEQPLKAQQVLLSLQNTTLPTQLQTRCNLLLARIYENDPTVSSEQLLGLLATPLPEGEYRRQQWALKASQYAKLGKWLLATEALLQSRDISRDIVEQAWEWVNYASPSEETTAAHLNAVTPFVTLKQLVREYGFDQAELVQRLVQFRQVYRGHPLVTYWPEQLDQVTELNPLQPENIVVLLPLSGRLKATGMAIKEGVLAAYFADTPSQNADNLPQLNFVDTHATPLAEMVEQANQADWVIGPLLKENVDALRGQLSPTVKMLALNRPDPATSPIDQPQIEQQPGALGLQVFYALAPEDEAKQLADNVFDSGKTAPIIVASEQSLHQRMQTAFINQWHKRTAGRASQQYKSPTVVAYTDNTGLRNGIQQALDVAQSKQRIKELQSFVDVELYNLPRNRLDIDAIVVFASPEQTELLNPVIEASISPFNGEPVPVFATSRSVDYTQSRNQWRDLQNLHFIDMPWLLPINPAPALAEQTQRLWPQRTTNLQRFFAFGVDAYNIIPKLGQMVWLPQLRYTGLTGNLSVNTKNEIIRMLPNVMVAQEAIRVVSAQ